MVATSDSRRDLGQEARHVLIQLVRGIESNVPVEGGRLRVALLKALPGDDDRALSELIFRRQCVQPYL
jgi:hypothetical protein